MRLERVIDYLMTMPHARTSGDGTKIYHDCPYCTGGNDAGKTHFMVSADIEEDAPMRFICFRASCGKKGVLTTDILREDFGCLDQEVLVELATHNTHINLKKEKNFEARERRDYVIANLPKGNNLAKLRYIQNRLGQNIGFDDLKNLKIQLSILEMLRINDINKIALSPNRMKLVDVYCMGFMSIFNDFLICRDITPDLKTGVRYYNYRISGSSGKKDVPIYTIPTEINLMDPRSAIINVAEGPFSILGAKLNTDVGDERPNSIWAANCGAYYQDTIMNLCKQYGLLKVRINCWSDTEIKNDYYRSLYDRLKGRLDIRRMTVWRNSLAEDFGHRREDIRLEPTTIYGKRD